MPEMEKLTINVNAVDLGQIELLVEQGFYSNRAEFIRLAIHDQLGKHADTVRDTAKRQLYVIGALIYSRDELEALRETGKHVDIRVVGFLGIADNVTAELALAVIESVSVRGIFKASREVKSALASRMQ